jgi:hypothetical protein
MTKDIEVFIEINNWYQTYAKVNYQNRFFFIDRRAGYLGLEEWEDEQSRSNRSVLTFLNKPVREWEIPYAQEPMNQEELAELVVELSKVNQDA